MEVVSTSNLFSPETEKTTADLDSQFHDGRTVKKQAIKNTYKQNGKMKTKQQWAKRKSDFLRKYIIFRK